MNKVDRIKITWPELNTSIYARSLPSNRPMFDWFVSNLPLKGVQSHVAVSGKVMYILDLLLKKPPPFRYEDVEAEFMPTMPDGRVTVGGLASGLVGTFAIKYGGLSEAMSYPSMAQVEEQYFDAMRRVGETVWNSIYRTKQIITCEIRAEEGP